MRPAAYARYSTDMQAATSIADQLRNIFNYCARMGWPEPRVFSDSEITGSRTDRPGYNDMMRAAEAREFDVLIVDDASRAWRDSVEQGRAVRFLKHWGVRLIGVSDAVDTGRDDYKINLGMRGLMNELYIDELAKKVHRGLTGKALNGFSAGGLSYGYRIVPGPIGADGKPQNNGREIEPQQAKIVVEIYERYARGESPRAIAHDLNRRKVPGPRGGTWAMTSIFGDVRRQLGILANPVYTGRVIWNRTDWVKHPVTGRRLRRERPESEWIVKEQPELRIVPEALWDTVQGRLKRFAATTEANRALRGAAARTGGPRARYPLSGILRCGVCGGAMVMTNKDYYGCLTYKDRGPSVCGNAVKVERTRAEAILLADVKKRWLTEDAFKIVEAGARRAIKEGSGDLDEARRALADAEKKHGNIMRAIEAGVVTKSTQGALVAAERAVEAAKAEIERVRRSPQPTALLPRLRETWQRLVADLRDVKDVMAVRRALEALFPEGIPVQAVKDAPVAKLEGGLGRLAAMTVVAGARSRSYREEAVHLPLH